jgi:hypothetical protein
MRLACRLSAYMENTHANCKVCLSLGLFEEMTWGTIAEGPIMRRCMHAGNSGPGMSGMKKVARSKGARVAASLDTGTVLHDLLQTVAPATPDSASGSSGSSSGSAAAAKCTLHASASSHPFAFVFSEKENTGPWR